MSNYIRISFPAEYDVDECEEKDTTKHIEVSEDTNVGVNVGVNELFEIIKKYPGKNSKELHLYFDVSNRTIERWLKTLKKREELNLLEHPG